MRENLREKDKEKEIVKMGIRQCLIFYNFKNKFLRICVPF